MGDPIGFRLYKGMTGKWGGLVIDLKLPTLKTFAEKKEGEKEEQGTLFLEMCSPKGKNDYDWANKIKFALGLTDIGKLLHFLETGVGTNDKKDLCVLVHDTNAGTQDRGKVIKTLQVSTKDLKTQGAFFELSLTENKEKKLVHKVPVSADEVKVLSALLRSVVPVLLGWVA